MELILIIVVLVLLFVRRRRVLGSQSRLLVIEGGARDRVEHMRRDFPSR
jgi:hypothetical protein